MPDAIASASDAELADIAAQVHAVLNVDPTKYGSTAAVVTDLNTKRNDFGTKLTAHISAQAAARSATQAKESSRDVLEDILRSIRNVAKAAKVSEADMAALGIPISSSSAPSNATRPTARVDTSQRLQHTIYWTEETTPDNKRRPRGAMGAEIWMKLDGPPPTDEKQCIFLTLDGSPPYLNQFDGPDAGKMAHYLLRWRMRDGSVGPWSETVSATVTG